MDAGDMSREQVAMPRSSFRRLLQVAISASESESSSSQSPRKRVKRMDTETFNDNDEECIEYVRDFKAKIEQKYGKSQLNRDYEFPRKKLDSFGRIDTSLDSERSLQSLNGVRFYHLDTQNDYRPYDAVERLATAIKVIGKININELRNQLRNSKTPTFELISGLMDAVKQEEVTRATFEIPFSKETHDQLDILKHIGRNARDPRVFSRKRKQKKSQDNLSNARSAKHSRRLRSGILGAPQQDSQSSLHHSTSGMHPMAPRFLKSPTGFKTAKGKEFVPEPIPASLSARYLKMKKREDYLRGSVEKESRLSSQSPRATKIEQLFASTSQHSGLNLPQGPSSIQHSYTLQHQLKMPKQKIGFSGLNSNSNPNIGMSAIASTSKHSTSRQKTATNKDQSVLLGLGNESASKSLKRQQNADASKKNSSVVPSAKRTGKSPSVQSNTSGKNLRLAAQVASESISSQSKLKLTSLFLSHLHSPTQAKSGKERRNTTNTTTHIDGGRMMRLTVTSAKNAAPLVQINNIVGEIKDTTQINKGVMNSSTLPNGPFDYSADGRVMQSQSSKQFVGGKLASQKRSRSKQSPSLEKQSIEMERTHLSPKQVRRVSQYDKQAIATYLQKNRLVNL